MNNKYTYVLLPIIIIIVCFVLWPSSQLMITDELSYYFQAKNWANGNIGNTIIDYVSGTTHTLIESHYPPGTSFVLAALSWVNQSLINYIGLFYLIGTILIMYRCLRKIDLPLISLSVLYLFLPLIFISRTTMSEMPSLLLVSVGIYIYYNNWSKSYLWLAFITGLSLVFRETNLLLLAPLAFFISRNNFLSLLAFLSGFLFRLVGYYILKKNPFYIKEGYDFGLEYIPDTLIIYVIVLIILLPLSPVWFTKIPRQNLKPFALAILSFLGLHLIYGNVVHVYSGYTNGILLNGRLWIPALPIFVIAMGHYLKGKIWITKYWVSVIVISIIGITHLGIHYKSYVQQSVYLQFSQAIKNATSQQLTFIDMDSRTPIYRYIYPYVSDRNWSDIDLIDDKHHISQVFKDKNSFRVAIISSGSTVAQSNKNDYFYKIIDELKLKYSVVNIQEVCPGNNSCLNVYEVSKKNK